MMRCRRRPWSERRPAIRRLAPRALFASAGPVASVALLGLDGLCSFRRICVIRQRAHRTLQDPSFDLLRIVVFPAVDEGTWREIHGRIAFPSLAGSGADTAELLFQGDAT